MVESVSIALPKLTAGALEVQTTLDVGIVTACFKGTADVACSPDLDSFVKQLHETVLQAKLATVVSDFRELELMTPSALKVFASWLALVEELPVEQHYRIHFVANPAIQWQRRSLAALRCFAVDLVSIETRS